MQLARIVVFTLVLVASPANLHLFGAEFLPKVGSWEMETVEKGLSCTGKLIIYNRTGNHFNGLIDYTLPNGPVWISAISLECNPKSKSIRIEHRDTYSTMDRKEMEGGTFVLVGKIDEAGQQLRDLVPTRSPFTARASAKWVSDSTEVTRVYSDEVVRSATTTDERRLLYLQWSNQYVLKPKGNPNGVRVMQGLDRILLRDLSTSKDPFVSRYSRVAYELAVMMLASKENSAKADIEYKDGLPAEIFDSVLSTIQDAQQDRFSLDPLKSLVNSDVLQKRFAQNSKQLSEYIIRAKTLDHFCDMLKQNHPHRDELLPNIKKPSTLVPSFKLQDDDVLLSIKNTTGVTLHNCMLRSRVEADQKKVDDYEKQYKSKNESPAIFFSLAGISVMPAIEADMAAIMYHRIAKAYPCYVPEWKPEDVIEMRIAKASWVSAVGKSVDVWIGADEGTATVPLSSSALRTAANSGSHPFNMNMGSKSATPKRRTGGIRRR